MDKCPGVRPISIGETIRRLTAKCASCVAGAETKNTCGTDQLCAGLEAGTEGGMHDITMEWDEHKHEEDWGFLIADARNAFNEPSRDQMPWNARHLWPSGARFTFNCCRHFANLLVQNGDGTVLVILGREELPRETRSA